MSAQVKLLGPTLLCVEMTEEKHEKGRELLMLLRRRGQSLTCAIENDGGRGGRAEIRIAVIQAVIGEARADGIESCVGADFGQCSRVRRAVRPDVKLLGPALLGIQVAEEQHQE